MKNKYLYSRLVYSMAYVCAVAILAFAALGLPNELLIAFAIACLVTGGFINTSKDEAEVEKKEPEEKEVLTTIDEEMEEAEKQAQAEA
jgi:hypothetical protein